MDDNLVDDIADRGARLGVLPGVGGLGDRLQDAQIAGDQRRLERDHLRAVRQRGEPLLHRPALGAERGQLFPRLAVVDHLLDRQVDRALQLALDRAQPPRRLFALGTGSGREPATLFVVLADEVVEFAAVGETGAQAVEDGRLDRLQVEAVPVVAGPGFLGLGAHDPRDRAAPAVLHRHAGAADAAGQKAGQQAAVAPPMGDVYTLGVVLAAVGGGEQFRRHDAQLGRFGRLPFGFSVDAGDAAARLRVFDHPHPVPDDAAVIDGVLENAVASLRVADQRRRPPEAAARRGDALAVQVAGDVARRSAGDVVFEDAPHDRRFGLDDRQFARSARDRRIAVRLAAGVAAVSHDAGHASADLVRQVLEIERPDQPANADLDDVGAAVVHRADFDAGMGQALVDAGQVLLVARQAVQRLDDQHVEAAGARRIHHRQKPVAPHDRGAGARAIVEGRLDGQALAPGEVGAQRQLIVDRTVSLKVARITGVDRRAQGHRSPRWIGLGRPCRVHDRRAPSSWQGPR